jgi:hypothetical protein
MSNTVVTETLLAPVAPTRRRVRAFFAPVDRVAGIPTLFDPAGLAGFNPDAPPAPWLDLGPCDGFTRTSSTQVEPLRTGAPATAASQVRTSVEAEVSVAFERWGKLQMGLTAGVQQMNVLALANGAAANASGGAAATAVPVQAGSTPTSVVLGAAGAAFAVGDVVVVDVDFDGSAGFVGSGVSGGFVKSAATIGNDVDYVRRISYNVARVTANVAGTLTLASPLLAGPPVIGMQASQVAAFCDREGGSFFAEWSALFCVDGEQGDRVVFHYPRLQAMAGGAETFSSIGAGLEQQMLQGRFRALPVRDANDGELCVCFRSYLPAAMRNV